MKWIDELKGKVFCPKCGKRLEKAQNTYDGIIVLSVTYCPKCNWADDHETKRN